MEDLIKALQIFSEYGNPQWPTHCEHDILLVMIDPDIVHEKDIARLDDLGFFVSTEHPDCFASYKFGSA